MLRALRFALVGGVNTTLDVTLFAVLTIFIGIPPTQANVLSYGTGIVVSFLLNRAWTFNDIRGDLPQQFARFLIVSLSALLISTLIVAALAPMMPAILAKLLSLPGMFLWSYVMTRRFVFWKAG
jgi:putative flippase GtrA